MGGIKRQDHDLTVFQITTHRVSGLFQRFYRTKSFVIVFTVDHIDLRMLADQTFHDLVAFCLGIIALFHVHQIPAVFCHSIRQRIGTADLGRSPQRTLNTNDMDIRCFQLLLFYIRR